MKKKQLLARIDYLEKCNDEWKKQCNKYSQMLENVKKQRNDLVEFFKNHLDIKKIITCPESDSTYVIFADGHNVKVKRRKGEKNDLSLAVAYALVKNSYNMNQIEKLIKRAKVIKKGDNLTTYINSRI